MSRNESMSIALDRIQAFIAEHGNASEDLSSHRAGVQFALFAIVSAIKLTPDFNMPMLRQFAQTALDHPPSEFADNAVFEEPLRLLLDVTASAETE